MLLKISETIDTDQVGYFILCNTATTFDFAGLLPTILKYFQNIYIRNYISALFFLYIFTFFSSYAILKLKTNNNSKERCAHIK